MGIIETVLGPRSKRDRGLPYTYEAWVDILDGQGLVPVYDHFFPPRSVAWSNIWMTWVCDPRGCDCTASTGGVKPA